jgi:hypothetical protein
MNLDFFRESLYLFFRRRADDRFLSEEFTQATVRRRSLEAVDPFNSFVDSTRPR